uniref:Type-1 angiotensin II receptor n=1 Tax=Lepisosteus oculatus TaxID=7918 RepID=W5NLK2_LEPOC|nr:PREDICTED: type-1 angiotensin II receptor [Lepisosteus oculatus]XP_015216537.1 PREDICTED: type-1 angiotensin II receptor [Lepisosteus oculatus]
MENTTQVPNITVNCTSSGRHAFLFILIPVIYSCNFVIGIVGNGLVVTVIYCYIKLETVASIFILNLALSDLTFLITLPLWATYTALGYHWPFGSFLCKAISGLVTFNLYSSVFFLTCLSIDRYLAIVHPVKSRPKRTIFYARVTCTLIWILAFLMSVPNMCFRDVFFMKDLNLTVCGLLYEPNNTNRILVGMSLMKSILGFLIPFATIITCYCLIGKAILDAYHVQKNKSRNDEVLKMLAAVVAAFFVCWFPHQIFHFMDILVNLNVIQNCKIVDIVDTAMPFTICVAYFNSCLNPILYSFVGNNFRKNLLRLLKCTPPLVVSHPSLSSKTSSISYRGSEILHLTTNKVVL